MPVSRTLMRASRPSVSSSSGTAQQLKAVFSHRLGKCGIRLGKVPPKPFRILFSGQDRDVD